MEGKACLGMEQVCWFRELGNAGGDLLSGLGVVSECIFSQAEMAEKPRIPFQL